MRRSGSSFPQFAQRIPADVKARAVGLKLSIPVGDETTTVVVTARMQAVRCSLKTHDPSEAKVRHANAAAYCEKVWRALRQDRPISLTHKQVTALAGKLYRAWADGAERERVTAVTYDGGRWVPDRETEEEAEAAFGVTVANLKALADKGDFEATLGPLVDRLLRAEGIGHVDPPTRSMLLTAFYRALEQALEVRQRNAAGDYAPDANAARFPAWEPPEAGAANTQSRGDRHGGNSLTGLVEGWWRESAALGLKPSTYESYRNTMAKFIAFLKT